MKFKNMKVKDQKSLYYVYIYMSRYIIFSTTSLALQYKNNKLAINSGQ